MSQGFSGDPYQSPQSAGGRPQSEQGDSTGGVIPYKNAPALISYYLGIFSLVPCLGLIAAIPAVILGVIGLQKVRQNPVIKGTVHAWIGIVLGGICTLLWGAAIIMAFIAPLLAR